MDVGRINFGPSNGIPRVFHTDTPQEPLDHSLGKNLSDLAGLIRSEPRMTRDDILEFIECNAKKLLKDGI